MGVCRTQHLLPTYFVQSTISHIYIYIYIYIYMYICIYNIYIYINITYLDLKTMIVQDNIKHINTIGLAAAKAAANPIVCRGLILFCTHCFLG